MRIPVEARRAYRLINHGPTTLITTALGSRRDVMAAAWVMPLDLDPPRVTAVIAKGTLTRELVDGSGEFVVCLPTTAMAAVTMAVGRESGRDVDKFARHGLTVTAGSTVAAPLIDGCVAWLECRVLPEPGPQGRYDLFVADVVAAWADDSVFRDGRWHFTQDHHRTIHHVAGGAFYATGVEVPTVA